MATKSAQPEVPKVDIEELLDILEQTLDRTKVMYEQYFLGIQKMAPAQLHSETERRIRDLTQMNIRNTALRYRFATVQQKFGSYNAYWRRTLRQIESGKYIRNLQKIGRNAARTGEDIPEEILNAMPKRMREQVKRDREQALANAARRAPRVRGEFEGEDATQEDLLFTSEAAPEHLDDDDVAAIISEPSELRRNLRQARGAHVVDEADSDLDLDAFFAQVAGEVKTEDPAAPPGPRKFRPSQQPPFQAVRLESEPPLTLEPEPPLTLAPLRPASGPGAASASVSSVTRARGATTPPPELRPAVKDRTPAPQLLPRDRTPAPQLSPRDRTPAPQLAPRDRTPAPQLVPPPPPAIVPAPKTTSVGMPATPRPPAPSLGPARLPNLPPAAKPTPAMPAVPAPPPRAATGGIPHIAPSQVTRPNPIAPGSSNRAPVPVESMNGPFPRNTPPPKPARPGTAQGVPPPAMRPPVGMTEQDVNTLYSKYVQAKEMVGEDAGPAAREKLMKTIHAQAPKIMEQYKAKGVDFSVVVKDNQVIIRAKPKT